MIEISEEQRDRIGQLGDKADNYLAAAQLKVAAAIHVEGLTAGMEELRDELNALYLELGGEL